MDISGRSLLCAWLYFNVFIIRGFCCFCDFYQLFVFLHCAFDSVSYTQWRIPGAHQNSRPLSVQFFSFHAVFLGKKLQNNRLAHCLGSWRPILGNRGFATDMWIRLKKSIINFYHSFVLLRKIPRVVSKYNCINLWWKRWHILESYRNFTQKKRNDLVVLLGGCTTLLMLF